MAMLAPGTHQMKTCPRCAEDIRAEALVCRFCGAEFTITREGYCTACHLTVAPNQDASTCPRCGTDLVDVHVVSEVVTPVQTPPATAPPPPVADAAPAEQVPPKGDLREAIVPAGRERIGFRLLNMSSGLLFALLLLGVMGLAYASGEPDPSPLSYWFLRPLGWATEVGGPPILLFVLVVPALLFLPRTVKPRGSVGAWLSGKSYLREFKKHYGEVPVKASSRKTMVIASLVTWVLIVLTCVGFMIGWSNDSSMEIGVPPFIALLIAVMGLTGSVLFLTTSHSRIVKMDDAGTVYG